MKKLIFVLSATTCLWACSDSNTQKSNTINTPTQTLSDPSSMDLSAVILEKVSEGPEYPGATLKIKDVVAKEIPNTDSAEVTINFDVQNYELKAQTPDASSRSCNNSKDGQHIHFILNNQPYVALYEPTHTFKVKKGEEQTMLTFLSRSYHLSLKYETAYQLLTFKVDEKGQYQQLENKKEPMLFYSRPKGTYLGEDTKNILLDFYVVNGGEKLKNGEYYIFANISGKEMKVTDWAPYFIKNLPMGEHTITLALMDKNNEMVGENKIQMKYTLAEKEPIQK